MVRDGIGRRFVADAGQIASFGGVRGSQPGNFARNRLFAHG